MATQISHFGINFPSNFPLDDNSCREIAKQLFLNINISTSKAKHLIENNEVWEEIRLINFKEDLLDISIGLPELLNLTKQEEIDLLLSDGLAEAESEFLSNDDLIFIRYRPKFIAWLQNFSYPKLSDINTIAEELSILDREKIVKYFRKLLYDEKLTKKELIIDYLFKYHRILSLKKIDKLLDLYSEKNQLLTKTP